LCVFVVVFLIIKKNTHKKKIYIYNREGELDIIFPTMFLSFISTGSSTGSVGTYPLYRTFPYFFFRSTSHLLLGYLQKKNEAKLNLSLFIIFV
jgi:hypothetical protein